MILCPAGWHEWRAGDALLYTQRKGRVHGVMTYRERVAPIRSFPALLADVLADDVEFEVTSKSKIKRFVSDEGEYGAAITVRGMHRGNPIAHIVAAIFLEDFSTLLDARVEELHIDEHVKLVLELAKSDRLNLGVRRRRVGFSPPKGWHPIPGLALEVVLLPPDYPTIHGAITMYPAEPIASTPDPVLMQNLHDERVGLGRGDETRQVAMTQAWKQGRPLVGEQVRTVRELPNKQGKLVRHLVVLRDERYLYVTKLETPEGEHLESLHATFVEMMGSIEPIPLPSIVRGSQVSGFELWAD